MFPIAHLLVPAVAVLLYGRWTDRTIPDIWLVVAGLTGVLPDLLNPHLDLAARASWSHSLLILIPLGIVVIITSDRARTYASLLFSGVTIHILLDILSAPYNFLYPLNFSYGIDLWPEIGPKWYLSWYAFDLLALTAFTILMLYREPS